MIMVNIDFHNLLKKNRSTAKILTNVKKKPPDHSRGFPNFYHVGGVTFQGDRHEKIPNLNSVTLSSYWICEC